MNLFRDSIILLSILLLISTPATEGKAGKTKQLRNFRRARPGQRARPAPAPGAPKPAAPKPAPGAPTSAPVDTKPSKFKKLSCTKLEDKVEGLFNTPWLGAAGVDEDALIDLLSICDGGACEVCDSLEFVHDETKDCAERVGNVKTFLEDTESMLDRTLTLVNIVDSIGNATKTMESVFEIIQPVTKGIPYVGPLLKVFNQAIGALKKPLQKVASKKDEIEKAKNRVEAQKKNFERTEKALDETACVIDASRKTMHVAKNASSCLECVETIPSYNIDPFLENIAAAFDVLVLPMGVCNTEIAVSLTLPELSINLKVLEDIEKVINDIAQFFQDVRDKIINDADMFLCCEDTGIALRTMGDFFSDLASLVTCAGDGVAAAAIQQSLDALLPKLNDLLVDVNKPIKEYNRAASEINSIFFKEEIRPKITSSRTPVIEITPCSQNVAALDVELFPVCSGESDSCGLPQIEPLSFGRGDRKFEPDAILKQIADQCEDSWNDVKDMEIDDCCPAAREKAGIPREGLANGQSCKKWGMCEGLGCLHWGSCKSDLCFQGTCVEPGKNGEACGDFRPCKEKEGFNCLVTGKCANGSLGSPCVLHSDCSKSSKNCGWDGNGNKICIAGIQGDYCQDKCSSGFKCQSVGNNKKQCIKEGTINASCSSNDDCKSGYCGKNSSGNRVCTSGGNGQYCDNNKNCSSGYCGKNTSGKRVCTSGGNGQRCGNNNQCSSNICGWDGKNNKICIAGRQGDYCDGKCSSGFKCQSVGNNKKRCFEEGGIDSSCGSNDDCKSGYCGKNSSGNRVCTSGGNGQYCDNNKNCSSGYCGKNTSGKRVCTSGGNGQRCGDNNQCSSNICGWDGNNNEICIAGRQGDYCDGKCSSGFKCQSVGNNKQQCFEEGGIDSSCGSNDDCKSGYCGKKKSGSRVCTSGDNGRYCDNDKNCKSSYCAWNGSGEKVCTAKKGNGSKCDEGRDCSSTHCGWDCKGNRVCIDGSKGSCCTGGDQCATGKCRSKKCT